MPRLFPFVLILAGLLSGNGFILPAARAQTVTIGVLAWQGSQAAEQRWHPLLEQLQQQLPAHQFRLQPLDPNGMERALSRRQLTFLITNPGHYVDMEARFGLSRIVGYVLAGAVAGPGVLGWLDRETVALAKPVADAALGQIGRAHV